MIGAVIVGTVALLLAQLVPYGRAHTNPAVVKEPAWDSASTRSLARRACFDCHSNQTTWPWYSNVAPISWLVYSDVMSGREHLNFSEWQRPQDVDLAEVAESVRGGSMPPPQYKITHASARLSAAERERLASGLERTVRASPPGG